jgi:heme-degrading monooxygenase HmoA
MTVTMVDGGMRPCTASMTGPVTLVVARRVLPGREADHERRLRALQQQVHGTEGYLGTEVVHKSAAHEYVSIVRFDSLANLRPWEASGQRERWQVELRGIVASDATVRHAEGLEFWFEGPQPCVSLHATPPAPDHRSIVRKHLDLRHYVSPPVAIPNPRAHFLGVTMPHPTGSPSQ